jgi:hypothetical protein
MRYRPVAVVPHSTTLLGWSGDGTIRTHCSPPLLYKTSSERDFII